MTGEIYASFDMTTFEYLLPIRERKLPKKNEPRERQFQPEHQWLEKKETLQ